MDSDITPDQIRASQLSDPTLARIHKAFEEQIIKGNAKYFKKRYFIYIQYSSSKVEYGKLFVQHVVPQQYGKIIMKLANESMISAHIAVKRTIQKVLPEFFFWPGIASDIKRYCHSCDICQRTIAKGKNARVPLGSMPIIDTTFKRVAIYLVSPLESH